MSKFQERRTEYERLTYRNDGDRTEKIASRDYDLDRRLPSVETFWKLHIAPSTNRPDNIAQRGNISPAMSRMGAQVNHIVNECLDASMSLADPISWRSPDEVDRSRASCFKVLGSLGNALQKVKDLRVDIIHEELSRDLGRPVRIDDNASWGGWRDRHLPIIEFRQMLTHDPQPPLIFDERARDLGPLVLRPEESMINRKPRLSWSQIGQIYRERPLKFGRLTDLTNQVLVAGLDWINGYFEVIVRAMEPLLDDNRYADLWGWGLETETGPVVAFGQTVFSYSSSSAFIGPMPGN